MIVLELLPFALLALLAWVGAVGLRRALGSERLGRLVHLMRPVPFVLAALVVFLSR